MAEDPLRVDPNQVAEIVSSYVRHHKIAADQLAGLIVEVHRALAGLGRAPPVQEPPRPAVPIRRSVQQDYIVCLECGFRAADAAPASASRARARCRRLPRPLETPAGLPSDCAELFGAALEDGEADYTIRRRSL